MAKKPAKHVDAVQQTAEVIATAVESSATALKFKHNKNVPLLGEIKPEAEISWHITVNPRSKGRATYDRFEAYLGKPTVADYLAAGGTLGDLRWDIRSGYLSVAGVELGGELATRAAPVAKEPKAKKVKAEKSAEAVEAEGELAAATQEETID